MEDKYCCTWVSQHYVSSRQERACQNNRIVCFVAKITIMIDKPILAERTLQEMGEIDIKKERRKKNRKRSCMSWRWRQSRARKREEKWKPSWSRVRPRPTGAIKSQIKTMNRQVDILFSADHITDFPPTVFTTQTPNIHSCLHGSKHGFGACLHPHFIFTFCDVMVNELDYQAITNAFASY